MIKQLKWLATAACSFIVLAASAQKPATVSGKLAIDSKEPISVKLYKVVDGSLSEIANSMTNKNGAFGFLFFPEYEGFYVIGRGNTMSPTYNYTFYLKPGDQLSVEIAPWDYTLTGTNNSKENKVLYSWHQLTDSIYGKSINFMHGVSTYVDFFPQLEATVKKANGWFKDKKTGNGAFDAVMPQYMKMDLALIACNFLQTPRTAHPAVEEFSEYYNTLHGKDFTKNTDMIYRFPYGYRTMTALANLDFRRSGEKLAPGMDFVKVFSPYIANDTLKGDFVLNHAEGLKDYQSYKDLMDEYGQYILTDRQKTSRLNIMTPLLKYKKGDDAYNFVYEDNHGKTIGLKDMKGKVVVVDVWATWCGPCKAQIPYLKKLEEEMKGKDVQFVSISVDEPKDKKKWLNFIDTAKLGGTQLFAGGWDVNAGLAKYYNIKGIPRFMVFDKNGKIISVDAPRPSEPALKEMLLEAIGN